jgi:hypothetical protein
MDVGVAAVGVTWGQGDHLVLRPRARNLHKFTVLGAGGTGIAPALCGCGACCRSFSNVQGRTRAGWKSLILIVQSTWTFTRVHRRWGQNRGQSSLALLFPPDIGKESRSCTHSMLDQPSMDCCHELASCSPLFGMASCLASYGILQQAHMLLYSPGCAHLRNGVCMGLSLPDQRMRELQYGQ